jgi:hypothetical protein
MIDVARVRRRGKTSTLKICLILYLSGKIWGGKEFLSFISGKIEWESSSSILVTRNPNWSQSSGTGTGCVKGRY